MIKPDGVRRGLMGSILQRYERAGLHLTAVKLITCTQEKAEIHYREHREKSFFPVLVAHLISGPSLIIATEGAHAIEVVRRLNGSTIPWKAEPGTIRGDFAHMVSPGSSDDEEIINNIVHASDTAESAFRELALWFDESDYVEPYKPELTDFN